jgi:hypothetical protein
MPAGDPHLGQVDVVAVGVLTESDKAMLEAGKKLLVDSIDVGREYCKYMIGIASGAIPAYIAVLKLGVPDKFVPTGGQYVIWTAPSVLFLLASLAFSTGYFPGKTTIAIDNMAGIADARTAIIDRRRCWSITGVSLFTVGVLVGLWAIFDR